MITKDVKEICEQIGEFYLNKNKGSYTYEKTEQEILRIGFTNIELDENKTKVTVTVARPGLFIGSRGQNIEQLEECLGKKIHIIESCENLNDYLIPVEPDEDYDSSYDCYWDEDQDYWDGFGDDELK